MTVAQTIVNNVAVLYFLYLMLIQNKMNILLVQIRSPLQGFTGSVRLAATTATT
jgi:hypothetical protein